MFLVISIDAAQGTEGSQTMQFDGFIQARLIVIFVDSGSTTSFVSQALVS